MANKYGNTDIDELHGLMNLDIKYGNLTAGKLTRGNVKPLEQAYTLPTEKEQLMKQAGSTLPKDMSEAWR